MSTGYEDAEKVVTGAVRAALEAAFQAGCSDTEALWAQFVYRESCEITFMPVKDRGDATVSIAFADLRQPDSDYFIAATLESLMLNEIEQDPHFAVAVARELRRVASLADDLEPPPA